MTERPSPSSIRPHHIAFKAGGSVLLVLGMAFVVFAAGFYVEGLIDLADGRMDGHAALDLPEAIATALFWRRIGTMVGFGLVLLSLSLACFWAFFALKPRS